MEMTGVEERDCQSSGIHVFRIHYTADPLKRSEEWQREAEIGMPGGRKGRAWQSEMEINWQTASGMPVYSEDFIRDFRVSKRTLIYNPLREMCRGWDLGATHQFPACVWGQVDSLGRLYILREMATWDGRGDPHSLDVPAFADNVISESNRYYPDLDWLDYSDPAAWTAQQVDTDAKSCIDVLREKRIYPRKGPVTFQDRKNSVLERLRKVVAGEPALVVDASCRMVIEALGGMYRYEQVGETGRFKPSVEKNAWSHIMNALEYLIGGLYSVPVREKESKPKKRRVKDPMTGY